jgi:tripartite-type tricarboxylate transporter receptor subunit TctC
MNNLIFNRRHVLAIPLAAGFPTLRAQNRSRNISVVVPQPAGNPTDGFSRKLQPFLQKTLGNPVVVENFPGAGGSIGLNKVLGMPADEPGITCISQTESILTPLTLLSVRYKPQDFTCVGLIGRAPFVLIGRPDLPAKTYAELVELGRMKGAKPLSLGNVGPGSMINLLGAQWSRKTGVPINHVPYKGLPPVINDLLGSQIDLTFAPFGGSVPNLLESGKVRIYGSTTASPRMPSLPILSKIDRSLSDFVYGAWAAFFVASKAPKEFIDQVHRALVYGFTDAETRTYIESTGVEPSGPLSLQQLDKFYRDETALHQRIAREVGVERT